MEKDFGKRLAVLSVSTITILGSTAVSPALSGIKSAFPQMSDSVIQLILTLPTLLIIPSCLLCRSAIRRMGEKRVLLMGITIYLIGGLGAGLMPNFYLLLAMRGVLGIGCGFITPMAQNLISSHFDGEVKVKMTSYSASASYLMGILASFTVGRLVGIQWRLAFTIYLVALAVLLLNAVYLPSDAPQERPAEAAGAQRYGPNVPALLTMLAMFGINGAFYTFSASISLFMRQERIGDDTTSGIVVSAFMVCGFVVGLLVPAVRRRIKGLTMALGALMMGCGYWLLSLAGSLPSLMAAAAMVGGSYSILYSGIFTRIRAQARGPEETTTLVTLTTAGMFLGQASSQYLLRGAELLLGHSGYRFRFALLAVILLVCAAGCVYHTCKRKKGSHAAA